MSFAIFWQIKKMFSFFFDWATFAGRFDLDCEETGVSLLRTIPTQFFENWLNRKSPYEICFGSILCGSFSEPHFFGEPKLFYLGSNNINDWWQNTNTVSERTIYWSNSWIYQISQFEIQSIGHAEFFQFCSLTWIQRLIHDISFF